VRCASWIRPNLSLERHTNSRTPCTACLSSILCGRLSGLAQLGRWAFDQAVRRAPRPRKAPNPLRLIPFVSRVEVRPWSSITSDSTSRTLP
jgi:hypothetical protein